MHTKSISFGLVAGWTTALFVGCTSIPSVGPDYERPDFEHPDAVLNDAGQTATEESDVRVNITTNELAKWWTRFNDPILVKLVEGAQTNNVPFKMAIKRLEQSEYELLGSYAAFMPKFAVDAGWQRHWANRYASTTGHRQHYSAQSVALDGNWEIDLFGGNRRLSEAALAQAEAMGWTVADAWVSLTTQIGVQYVTLRTTQERIAVARTNLALQSETYEILKSRLESGIGDELAVNQCAYIVEQTRANIPTLLAQEEKLKNAIAILAGEMPGALEEMLKPLEEPRDWLLAPQKVDELPLDLLRGRPDVMAAERRLAAETAYIGVAKAQWFPKLFVTGQVGLQTTHDHKLFNKDSFFAILGPSVSWPILQGGAIYASVKVAEARMEEAALAYEHALESAYGDLRDAYSSYTHEYHRYQSLQTAVKAASDAVTISRDLYRNGLRDFNNVLDAQRSRLQLEEAAVLSRGQITLDLISLYKSLGGGLAATELEEDEIEE